MPDSRPPRSFRSNVDADIAAEEQRIKEIEAEIRSNQRMRRFFGGNATDRGFGNYGRMDSEIEAAQRRLQSAQDELRRAREYRREYPDEVPAGSSTRPRLVYKKGGPVKITSKATKPKKPAPFKMGGRVSMKKGKK
jgi:uncharacterized protein YukE